MCQTNKTPNRLLHEYKAGPDTAKAKVKIKVAFSVLNIME
jgi:hypothetical protein